MKTSIRKTSIPAVLLSISGLIFSGAGFGQAEQSPADAAQPVLANLDDDEGVYAVFLPQGGTYAIDELSGGSWYQTAAGDVIGCGALKGLESCTTAIQSDEKLFEGSVDAKSGINSNTEFQRPTPARSAASVDKKINIRPHNCDMYSHTGIGETCTIVNSRSESGAPDDGVYVLCLEGNTCMAMNFVYRPLDDTKTDFDNRILNPAFLLSIIAPG